MKMQGVTAAAKRNLPDESHPKIQVGDVFLGLRNDVHQLVPRLIDPVLHLRYRKTKLTKFSAKHRELSCGLSDTLGRHSCHNGDWLHKL